MSVGFNSEIQVEAKDRYSNTLDDPSAHLVMTTGVGLQSVSLLPTELRSGVHTRCVCYCVVCTKSPFPVSFVIRPWHFFTLLP